MKSIPLFSAHAALAVLVPPVPALPVLAQTDATAPRPNILLIFPDNSGHADVGFNAEPFGVETDAFTPGIAAGLKSWQENGMPLYERTFAPH